MVNELDNLMDIYDKTKIFTEENELIIGHYAEKIVQKYKSGTNTCLDLGIGHGVTISRFSEIFAKYMVIEGSQKIIDSFKKKCRYNIDTTNIVHSYFENFETDEKFDVIVMGFILEHVNDPLLILNKFKNFLKKEGRIFIALPNHESLNRRIGVKMGIIETTEFFSDNDIKLGHKHLFNVDSFNKLVDLAKLRLISLEGIYLKPITTEQMHILGLDKNFLHSLMTLGEKYPELSVSFFAELELGNNNYD